MQVSAHATCLTLTAMSVDRYQAIVHPLKSLRTRTTKAASVVSLCVWSCKFIRALLQNYKFSPNDTLLQILHG